MFGGWMIKRFVDPRAEFRYVPNDTDPATVTDGTPWHIGSTAELSTHDGHAAWYWISKKYRLGENDPVVAKMEEMFPLTRLVYVSLNEDDALINDAVPPGAPLEAAGLATVLYGVTASTTDPAEAMRRSGVIFDATYEALRAQRGRTPKTIDFAKHAVGAG
jgi:hypothetical protein